MQTSVWAFLTDLHIPYQHEKALEFTFELLEIIQPSGIILGGDFLDFYNLNMHGPMHPEVREDLSFEVDQGRAVLRRIERTFPKAQKIFIEGNHENRLSRFVIKNCINLYNFVRFDQMIRIDRTDWKLIPYGNDQIFKIPDIDLCVRHEPLKMGIHACKNTVDHAKINLLFGHTHRAQSETSINLLGEVFRAYSPGWLGDMKKSPEVFSYLKNTTNWTLGFSLVIADFAQKIYHVRHIDFKEYPDGSLSTELFGRIFRR